MVNINLLTFIKIGLIFRIMIRRDFNIKILPWLWSCLLLLLICSSPVYSSFHSIHSHLKSSSNLVSHLSEVDLEHSWDHHHHRDKTDSDDHQHSYDNEIDWHIIRVQNLRQLSFDEQFVLNVIFSIPIEDKETSFEVGEILPFIDYNYSHSLIIRGPPLSV